MTAGEPAVSPTPVHTRDARWPGGRRFAFTIFDDTDRATLGNVREVYALLADLGFRTTKSVWPLRGPGEALIPGETCEDREYLDWVLGLQSKGFEIGLHNATFHTSERAETIRALDRFRSLFGHDPYTAANHASNEEAIYWGSARVSGGRRLVYDAMHGFRGPGRFRGHVEGDSLFWGDVCRDRIRYVRNFVFADIDTLKATPFMPYRDPDRPFVNLWFASSEGATVESFCDTLETSSQARLEREGGACIMYTHFGKGFYRDGALNPRFRSLMESLARRDGWYPTTCELLDHLRDRGAGQVLPARLRNGMERRWLVDRAVSQLRSAAKSLGSRLTAPRRNPPGPAQPPRLS